MTKLTTFNTKLLLAAIAAVAALGVAALILIAPNLTRQSGGSSPTAPLSPGLHLLDKARSLPDASFTDGAGQQMGLSGYRGKIVLVNFWATWCEPCKLEMPSLLRLQQKLGGKDFVVVAISGDQTGAKAVEPFLKENDLTALNVLYDLNLTSAGIWGVKGLPTTILLDREGREIGRAEGGLAWDTPDIEGRIEAKIKAAP